MLPPEFFAFLTILQLLSRVLMYGLQHHEAWLSTHPLFLLQQVITHQRLHAIQHVYLQIAPGVTNSLYGLKRATALEDGKAAEQLLFSFIKEVVAPLDSSSEGLLASSQVFRPTC